MPPPKYVAERTVADLRRHARESGIQVPSNARKEDLVSAVAKHASREKLKPGSAKKTGGSGSRAKAPAAPGVPKYIHDQTVDTLKKHARERTSSRGPSRATSPRSC